MTNKRTNELLELDLKHLLHPVTPVGQNAGRIFERAEGVMLYDTEGKEYMDLASQLVSVNLGHGRKEIIDAAIAQMKKYQYGTTFYGLSNIPSIECSQKLAGLTQTGLNHFHYCSGGSEANENAFRIARQYWQKKGTRKDRIISLYNSYHGITLGTGSSSGLGGGMIYAYTGPMEYGFFHTPNYDCYKCSLGLEYPSCNIACAHLIGQVIENEGQGTIAAFIAEPIQGSGGAIAPPPEYWPIVRKICTEHEVLLIADEVMSGWARSGPLFAMENWSVVPDIMTTAKGITGGYLPFGVTAINDEIYETLKDDYLWCGYTYSCNPTCAAAAVAAMEVYVKEKISEHVIEVGKHIDERLKAEFLTLPYVGALNGQGFFRAMRLVKDKTSKTPADGSVTKEVQQKGFENGLFLRIGAAGIPNVFFCPPLIATQEEVDRGLDILLRIISDIKM